MTIIWKDMLVESTFLFFQFDYPIASKLEEWIVLEHLMLTDKMFKKYKYKKPIFIPVHK